MIFYLSVNEEGHTKIAGTQAEAKAINPEYSQIEVPTDKTGLMGWIQQMLDETVNQVQGITEVTQATLPPEPVKESYTEKSVRFEEAWDGFPLKLKCHFASLAMEECRSILK